MKARRTRYFRYALFASLGFSALFIGWFVLFGRRLAPAHFGGVTGAVFSVMALATLSFLVFCFLPYFRGDRRWYSISALLTVVFLVGAAMLWQVPGTAVSL